MTSPETDTDKAMPAHPSTLTREQELVRTTVKWMITALAAVGTALSAALAAGGQLSNIGALQIGWRLLLAIGAAGAALFGVMLAIWVAARVLTPVRPLLGEIVKSNDAPSSETRRQRRAREELKDAAKWLDKHEELFTSEWTNLEEFYTEYRRALAEGDQGGDEAKTRALSMRTYGGHLVEMIEYHISLERFLDSVRVLLPSAFAVGLAIAVFAWAANPDEATQFEPPYQAIVHLTNEGIEALSEALGPGCASSPFGAIVLAEEPQVRELLSLPSRSCSAVRFELTSNLGTVSLGG